MTESPTPQDALYAWIVPFYGKVAATEASKLLAANPDVRWEAIKAEIVKQTGTQHSEVLQRMFEMKQTHEALAALERLWNPLSR